MPAELNHTIVKCTDKQASAMPKKSVDKPAGVTPKAVTKPVRIAKVDPLAPLPAKHSGHSKEIAADR